MISKSKQLGFISWLNWTDGNARARNLSKQKQAKSMHGLHEILNGLCPALVKTRPLRLLGEIPHALVTMRVLWLQLGKNPTLGDSVD